MTQQDIHDFMTANGFHWENASGFGTSDGWWKDNLYFSPIQAEFMLQLKLEAQRDEAELNVCFAKTCASLGHYIAHGEERLAELNNQIK